MPPPTGVGSLLRGRVLLGRMRDPFEFGGGEAAWRFGDTGHRTDTIRTFDFQQHMQAGKTRVVKIILPR